MTGRDESMSAWSTCVACRVARSHLPPVENSEFVKPVTLPPVSPDLERIRCPPDRLPARKPCGALLKRRQYGSADAQNQILHHRGQLRGERAKQVGEPSDTRSIDCGLSSSRGRAGATGERRNEPTGQRRRSQRARHPHAAGHRGVEGGHGSALAGRGCRNDQRLSDFFVDSPPGPRSARRPIVALIVAPGTMLCAAGCRNPTSLYFGAHHVLRRFDRAGAPMPEAGRRNEQPGRCRPTQADGGRESRTRGGAG
jgi:hypothetical protein